MTTVTQLTLITSLLLAAAFRSSNCNAQEVTADQNLLGYWKFEETMGSTVRDFSGHGNDGVMVPASAVTFVQRSGPFAGTLFLGGDSDHFVRISPTTTINTLKNQITVVTLLYPTTLWEPHKTRATLFHRVVAKLQREWNGIVNYILRLLGMSPESAYPSSLPTGFAAIVQRQWRDTAHPDQFFLGYGPQNNALHYKWHIGLMDGSEISLYFLPNGEERPRTAEWVQLAGTYDGVSGKMSLYVNGALIGSLTHPGEIRLDSQSVSRPIIIGAELNGPNTDQGSGEFNGYIRDVRIYNRALTNNEITALFETRIRLAQ